MENIKYLILMWGAALLCILMGIHTIKSKKPANLFTTSSVSPEQVTDVKAYNRAVGKMYCLFSTPLWIFGVIELWIPQVSILFFCLFCVFGIGAAVWCYHKIEEKYFIK